MKSVLIVGINSAIGRFAKEKFESNKWIVYGTTKNTNELNEKTLYLDLLDPKSFVLDENILIDVVVFCASITKIKDCCEKKLFCKKINLDAQVFLAILLKKHSNPFMIFLSSSTVFDGKSPFMREDDNVCPSNFYGKLKADAEEELKKITDKIAIVRATKVLYMEHFLVKKWIDDLNSMKNIAPFSDLTLSPISMELVITAIFLLATMKKSGVFHLSGESDITYVDIANYLLKKLSIDKELINPINAIGYLISEQYAPKYTSLDMANSKKDLSLFPESYMSILDRIFNA